MEKYREKSRRVLEEKQTLWFTLHPRNSEEKEGKGDGHRRRKGSAIEIQ